MPALTLNGDQIREANEHVKDKFVIQGDGEEFSADWDSLEFWFGIPPLNPEGLDIDDFEWGAYVGGSPDQEQPKTHTYLALVARNKKTNKSISMASVTGSRVPSHYGSMKRLTAASQS